MHIGLIGGIGPAATVAYYQEVLRVFGEAKQDVEITISHADVSVLIQNAASGQREVQARVFATHLDRLSAAGCDCATITALTGHFCFNEVEKLSPLPLINAITPVDRYCRANGISTIGLLGSPTVMASHLFGQLQQTRSVIPAVGTEELGKAYLEMASSGVCSEQSRALFFEAGSEMTDHQGADAILLAGTDLGLAFSGQDPGFRVVDALTVHVEHMLTLAMRKNV